MVFIRFFRDIHMFGDTDVSYTLFGFIGKELLSF